MTVSHILKAKGRDVTTAAATAKISEIAKILSEQRIGAVVITGVGGRIEGIVSEDISEEAGQVEWTSHRRNQKQNQHCQNWYQIQC